MPATTSSTATPAPTRWRRRRQRHAGRRWRQRHAQWRRGHRHGAALGQPRRLLGGLQRGNRHRHAVGPAQRNARRGRHHLRRRAGAVRGPDRRRHRVRPGADRRQPERQRDRGKLGQRDGDRHRHRRRPGSGNGAELLLDQQCRRPLRDQYEQRPADGGERGAARLRERDLARDHRAGDRRPGAHLRQGVHHQCDQRERGALQRDAFGKLGERERGERDGDRHRHRLRPGCRDDAGLFAHQQCRRPLRDQCDHGPADGGQRVAAQLRERDRAWHHGAGHRSDRAHLSTRPSRSAWAT